MIRTISDFFDSNGLKMFLPRRLSKLIELIFSCADAIFIAIFLFFLFSHSLFDFNSSLFDFMKNRPDRARFSRATLRMNTRSDHYAVVKRATRLNADSLFFVWEARVSCERLEDRIFRRLKRFQKSWINLILLLFHIFPCDFRQMPLTEVQTKKSRDLSSGLQTSSHNR